MNTIRFMGDDREEEYDLASGGGWALVGKWIHSLPEEEYKTLRELVEKGVAQDTLALSNELGKALDDNPPKDPDTKDVAEKLYQNLGVGSPDEHAMVL